MWTKIAAFIVIVLTILFTHQKLTKLEHRIEVIEKSTAVLNIACSCEHEWGFLSQTDVGTDLVPIDGNMLNMKVISKTVSHEEICSKCNLIRHTDCETGEVKYQQERK